jgi:predicted transcriptional regulator
MKPNKELAATMLVEGWLHKDVAEETGVTPQTISVWLTEPEFVAFVNKLKMENLHKARDRIQALSVKAAATIEDIMDNGSNDAVRLKAAESVLEMSGMINVESGMWAWGIGPTTTQGMTIELERKKQKDTIGFTL